MSERAMPAVRAGRLPPAGRAAVLLLPAALVGLGLIARALAARAFDLFIRYETPFAFPPAPQPAVPALTPRVVLVLVDGLGVQASRSLPVLNSLRSRGADLTCRIGLPSLSLPARAVLMSGAWPEVHGQTTNYGPSPLCVEHLFALARARGLHTALAASESTQTLFAPHVARPAVHPEEPETAPFARYEEAHARQVETALGLLRERGPGLLLLELYVVDEAGHGWGSRSEEYAQAAALADEGLGRLAGEVDLAEETLVVTADHGHVAEGGHGGPEPAVMQVPLVLAGRGVRRGYGGECAQVDIAPTLSALLGLPMPASSQGRPLVDALEMEPEARRAVLRSAVAQRSAFVRRYGERLARLGPEGGDAAAAAAAAADEAPAGEAAGDEKALRARLDELARAEAGAKRDRQGLESVVRSRRSLLVAGLPPLLVLLLWRLRVVRGREVGVALAAAAAGVAAYSALLPALGLAYSLTAVNKDEWLQWFFLKDMALGVTACAAAAALACAWARRRGASRLLDLSRMAWLTALAFSYLFLLKAAFIYWQQDVFPRWAIPDQSWGLAFYLDVLVVMAVGLCSPLLAGVAALARLVPAR